jgi:hypothetical protein
MEAKVVAKGRLSWVFLSWNTTNVHFCTFVPERISRSRVVYTGRANCRDSAMPHKNALNLDSAHNTAIRAEIGNRLRVLLPEEQPSPSPRIQHSLDCLNALDATGADLAIGGLSWRPPF